MSKFQIGILAVFIVFIALGLLISSGAFGTNQGNNPNNQEISVVVWGTMPSETFMTAYQTISLNANVRMNMRYEQKNPTTYENDMLEAFASNASPDIVILPDSLLLKYRNKVRPIPYSIIPERTYKDAYVEGAEIFLFKEGIVALPFALDPLVLYWNKDIFTTENVPSAPKFWDEFLTLTPKLTKKDQANNISQGAIALGEISNIKNGKDILAFLILQTGTKIISLVDNTIPISTLKQDVRAAESAIRFFTEFSNQARPTYSWNKSLREAQDLFIAEEIAMYLGFASEIKTIQTKNPHLNFDIAIPPQIRDANKVSYGRFFGVAIPNGTQNAGALQAALFFSSPAFVKAYTDISGTAPVLRGLHSPLPTDPNAVIFYESGLSAHSWLDPDPKETYTIFKDMVDNITSGRERVGEALETSSSFLERLLK